MQNTIFYVAAYETLGVVRDYANAKNATAPTLVRGVEACLKMRLFADRDGWEPYPISALSNIVAWSWAMDNDFNEATTYKLVGDNDKITVSEVTEIVDEEEITYTEVMIPIPNMNTEDLSTWLGTEKSKTGLHGELVGLDADGKEVFIVQVENFTIRNRISSLGIPTEIDPDYLTAGQVRALVSSGMECEFSKDGSEWHSQQAITDRLMHMRLRGSESGAWSDPIGLIAGPKGERGINAYCYVAYASDASGNGFSLTPANGLKFRAEIHTTAEITSPSPTDFSAAKWVKYIGEDGSGVGDMVKSVYDPNDDGKVLSAAEADHAAQADAVPWSGVSGKPESFTPATHSHSLRDIGNPVYQRVLAGYDPKTLYLNCPIVRNTHANSSGTIELEFTAIEDKEEGSAYTVSETEMLTWEYHVLCSAQVTGVSVGSTGCSMVGVNIPEVLDLINNQQTYHVFVIRAVRKSGAINNVRFQANYAYSYEA